jgi:hypothetical protein
MTRGQFLLGLGPGALPSDAMVRLLPAHGCLPADGGRRWQNREGVHRLRQRERVRHNTPEDACDQIDRLVKQSNGGFGAYLQLAHDWADPEAKFRSYELFARHVAPRFQGQRHATVDAKHRAAAARPELAASNLKAVETATAKYLAELDSKKKPAAKPKTKAKK